MNRKHMAFLALPLEILFLQVGFYFAGRWVDQAMGWNMIAEIAGPILGFAIWIYHLAIMIKAVSREPADPEDEGENQNPS